MTTVQFTGVGLVDHKKELLEEFSLSVESSTISAICPDKFERVGAIFDLIQGQIKADEGTVIVNDHDARHDRKKLGQSIGYLPSSLQASKHVSVKEYLNNSLKKAKEGHLSAEQANSIIDQLKIDSDARLGDLDEVELRQVEIVKLVSLKLPILLMVNPTAGMDEISANSIWQLLTDYVEKTHATILFTSESVPEMQRWSNHIIYVSNGHVSQIRQILTHDSSDCVVKVIGAGLPVDTVATLGGHFIEETPAKQEFIFSGSIQSLLPLLEQSGITDVRITDATVADELLVW
ncbi:ATP-binding cassette domain-containing protein [Paucilactobacillus suebicus]|uniref:Multidrug ABC transporter ATPase protein n=1 Tax=Paucilactobacillus suebicus DSM 5007 = KCTC 3549 TaxID=1423807 RepID=A0A0R1WAP6_9LACO|nr:ATP-binding cassette domain-containing protein [Paucilactobacillus suebicus]KRM12131.1 multidrug ABC transporter ATPase protein [Paucilactobacillus suebicus DSM 5007 = KCTC 3549]